MTPHDGDGSGRRAASAPGLAPVTYLPGVTPPLDPPPAQEAPVRWAVPLEPEPGALTADVPEESEGSAADDAEELLTRRLRRSALSEREARSFLAQRATEPAVIEATIERFTARGWVDDAVLAEQLIHSATSRKGQGRRAIAQTLQARGIARDIAETALAVLPDDDDDRALEYARSKAHGLRSYDLETAMRRLMGQLARRGYSGSVASNAARTALTEQRSGGGVQFR